MNFKVFETPIAPTPETRPMEMYGGGEVKPARMFRGSKVASRFGGAPPQRTQNTDNEPDPRFVNELTPEEMALLIQNDKGLILLRR